MPRPSHLFIALLLAASSSANAQLISPPGVAVPTVILVRSPEGVSATNASVRVLGYNVLRYTDSDGRAILPAFARGDFLLLLQSSTDGTVLRGISTNGVADTVRVRLARRSPSIGEYGTINVLTEPLAAAADRRARRVGGVLAGARLQRFRTIGDAVLFLSGAAEARLHGCTRIGTQGAAPSGGSLRRPGEIIEARPAGSRVASVAPTGETSSEDVATLAEPTEGLEAIEWIDASSVPLAFEGVPTGCQVVMLWR